MNPQIQSEKELTITNNDRNCYYRISDTFSRTVLLPMRVVSLIWLRNWYQTGGSDRVEVVRHLEFLKSLVVSGKMES